MSVSASDQTPVGEAKPVSPLVSIIGSIIGGALSLFGFVWMWSPIPFGIVLLAIGLTILIGVNPWIRRLIRRLRAKYGKLDNALDAIQAQERTPKPIRDALKRTDPE